VGTGVRIRVLGFLASYGFRSCPHPWPFSTRLRQGYVWLRDSGTRNIADSSHLQTKRGHKPALGYTAVGGLWVEFQMCSGSPIVEEPNRSPERTTYASPVAKALGRSATQYRSPVSGDINEFHSLTGHLGSNILDDQWHTISVLGRIKSAFSEEQSHCRMLA